MKRVSDPTDTVFSNKITRSRIVLSCKDSPRKPLGRRPADSGLSESGGHENEMEREHNEKVKTHTLNFSPERQGRHPPSSMPLQVFRISRNIIDEHLIESVK